MLTKQVRDELLGIAQTYAKGHGLRLSQVSRDCYGNASFLDQFKRGQSSVTVKQLEKMLRYFGANWPKGVKPPLSRPIFMRVLPPKN